MDEEREAGSVNGAATRLKRRVRYLLETGVEAEGWEFR